MIPEDKFAVRIHQDSLWFKKYAGEQPNTEVRVVGYEWGVCASVIDYEQGEILFHADLLVESGGM